MRVLYKASKQQFFCQRMVGTLRRLRYLLLQSKALGKAHFNRPTNDKDALATLGPEMLNEFPKDFLHLTGRGYKFSQLSKFREKRNVIVHYGSRPKDSEETAFLITPLRSHY